MEEPEPATEAARLLISDELTRRLACQGLELQEPLFEFHAVPTVRPVREARTAPD